MRFPAEVEAAAAHHGISTAMAFGLGEGLNLYYSRHPDEPPPHRLRVLPPTFTTRLTERVAQPQNKALPAALAGNGYAVMICTGDWHGLDAIEKWGEDLSCWPLTDGWERSVETTVQFIETSDGLYRRAYAAFLDEAAPHIGSLDGSRTLLHEIADEWLTIATRLRAGDELERLGSRILRMAGRESRFWGQILDRFGQGI